MPCRSEPTIAIPAFPPDFPRDTNHFIEAMAEHNGARAQAGLPALRFDELAGADRSLVLARAQQLKTANAEVVSLLTRHPTLCRVAAAFAWLFCGFGGSQERAA